MSDEAHLQFDPDVGLNQHAYRSEWASLEDEIADDAAQALPMLADFAERLLRDAGFPVGDSVAGAGAEPEIMLTYREARRIADVSGGGGDVAPEDVADAVEGFRTIFEEVMGDVSLEDDTSPGPG